MPKTVSVSVKQAKSVVSQLGRGTKRILEDLGISRRSFALDVGIPERTFYDFTDGEKDKDAGISVLLVTLDRLSEILGKQVDIADLLQAADPQKSSTAEVTRSAIVSSNGSNSKRGAVVTKGITVKYKSTIAALIGHVLETEKISLQEFASRGDLDISRIKSIMEGAEPSENEYNEIARIINLGGFNWTGEMLRTAWNRQVVSNGNGNSDSNERISG